jgi:predicted hotdog family 3-hydroxylacyl-ACP dehydratase
MVRPTSLLALALTLLYTLAAHAQSGAPEQPMETAGPMAIWAFVILFFGAIAIYVWLTWRANRKSRHAGHAGSERTERT